VSMTQALDYGRRAERQRSEEPDVDPQVRFCERGRPPGRSLLDPTASAVGMRRRIHAARVAGDRIPFARYADLFLPRTAPTAEAVGCAPESAREQTSESLVWSNAH